MKTYEDNLLAARFAALAAQPLSGDWDDVLDRAAGALSPRRGRLARSLWRGDRRRKLVVALAVSVVVAAVAAAAYGTVRVLFLDKGFIGLPPVGATPSAPQSGELVVHWFGFSATLPGGPIVRRPGEGGGPIARAWVYADGRIIWDRRSHGPTATRIPEGANELTSGYLEQRLTAEGVELMRSEVAGLLDRSRTVLETVPADVDQWWGGSDGRLALFVPNDYGSGWGLVVARDGDRLVRLQWRDHEGGFEGPIATPEQLSALRRLDALLTDPASVLPPSAWAERKVRAYVPSHYAVCIDTSPPKDASQLLSLLPARAADVLRSKSRTRSDGEVVEAPNVVLGRSVTYCSKLTTEEAREVADSLFGLDPEPGWRRFGLAYRMAEAVNNLNPTRIWFEPYFPHGQFTFSGPFG
jgi:hypothetical protein